MPLAIKAGTLIDGQGGDPLANAIVLIEGDRISEVITDPEWSIPDEYEVIDASKYTVLPGLIDSHLHIRGSGDPKDRVFGAAALGQSIGTLTMNSYRNALRDLEAGYTTLRDAGDTEYASVAVRNAINDGLLPGPRLWVSGPGITSTSGHMDREKGLAPHVQVRGTPTVADGPVEARRAVRLNLRYDVDHIKTNITLSEHVRRYTWECAPEMTKETIAAIVEEAHWHGRRVTAHCHGGPAVTWAIEAGIDGLEHGFFISDEQFDMMAENDVYFCPTMSVMGRYREMDARGEKADDPRLQAWRELAMAASVESVSRAHGRGVKIIAGSDAIMPGVRHGSNAYELELLVEAGLTPMEAIVATTGRAAEGIGFPEVGTVAGGKYADLVFFRGNPLEDITLMQDLGRVEVVIKGGDVVVNRAQGTGENRLALTNLKNLVLTQHD